MRRLLLSIWLVAVAFFGATSLPQPCLGDTHGQACSATSCQCVSTCSCQVAHRLDQDSCHLSQKPAAKLPATHWSPPNPDWQADRPPVPTWAIPLNRLPLERAAPSARQWSFPDLPTPDKPPQATA